MPFKDPDARKEYDRRWREAHIDRVRARGRRANAKYRHAHPERVKEADRRWRVNGGGAKAMHKWRTENLEEARAYSRAASAAYRKAHPDKVYSYNVLRRARKTGVFVEKVYRSVVWKRDGGICGICRQPADPTNWHLDHVIPLVAGGPHSYTNTQVSHPLCNLSKGVTCGVEL